LENNLEIFNDLKDELHEMLDKTEVSDTLSDVLTQISSANRNNNSYSVPKKPLKSSFKKKGGRKSNKTIKNKSRRKK
jgi:carbamate kinase